MNSPERATILTNAAIAKISEEKVWRGRDIATEATAVINATVVALRVVTVVDVWLKGFN